MNFMKGINKLCLMADRRVQATPGIQDLAWYPQLGCGGVLLKIDNLK